MHWQSTHTFPALGINQIHIWRANLCHSKIELAKFTKLLTPEEKARANKFVKEHAKNNFIVARGILRYLLAKYLKIDPQNLSLRQNKYGKLYLDSSALQFNVSHSHSLALFAFTMRYPIGIDVEFIRDNFDFVSVAQKFFSKKEKMDLLALPTKKQLHAFFNCWSRKEAFIKAVGKGIFCRPGNFSVEVSTKKRGKLRMQSNNKKLDAKDWSLEALNPKNGYVGAFVISNNEYKTKLYDFDIALSQHCENCFVQ